MSETVRQIAISMTLALSTFVRNIFFVRLISHNIRKARNRKRMKRSRPAKPCHSGYCAQTVKAGALDLSFHSMVKVVAFGSSQKRSHDLEFLGFRNSQAADLGAKLI